MVTKLQFDKPVAWCEKCQIFVSYEKEDLLKTPPKRKQYTDIDEFYWQIRCCVCNGIVWVKEWNNNG